jgi:AcrR family transcriptional regulator
VEYNSNTEQKILDAARTVFLKKGHDGARMQEIADLAGINKALLHYYFRSKDKLFRMIFRQEILIMLDNIFSLISPSDSFYDFLKKFIHEYLKNISTRRNVMRFILWELENSVDELAGWFTVAFQKRGFHGNPVIFRVEKAIQEGEIRAVNPVNFVLNLLGMCVFPFVAAPLLNHILPGFNIKSSTFTTEREAAILELIWDGIKSDN